MESSEYEQENMAFPAPKSLGCLHLNDSQPLFATQTNFLPSDEETQSEIRLNRLWVEVEALTHNLYDTKRAMSREERALFELRAQRAPILRVPDDILLHVFQLGIESSLAVVSKQKGRSRYHHWPSSLDHPFQVLASHVCARWRRLALSTAAFWTDLAVREPLTPKNLQFTLWSERSGQAPLKLSIVGFEAHPSSGKRWWPRYGWLLKQFANRLIKFSLQACKHTCFQTLHDLAGCVPLLRQFEMSIVPCDHDDSAARKQVREAAHIDAPNITSAILRGNELLSADILHLHLLRSLHISCDDQPPPARVLLDILGACTALRHLKLERNCLKDYDARRDGLLNILIPPIETLDLCSETSYTQQLSWLAHMGFPSLKRLLLGDPEDRLLNPDPPGPPSESAQRMTDKAVCFASLAQLRSLQLKYYDFTRESDFAHTIRLLRQGALPHLHDLYISQPFPLDPNWSFHWPRWTRNVLTELLRGRVRAGIPLPCLRVHPPLHAGDAWGLNYALTLASTMADDEESEFGLDLLFAEASAPPSSAEVGPLDRGHFPEACDE